MRLVDRVVGVSGRRLTKRHFVTSSGHRRSAVYHPWPGSRHPGRDDRRRSPQPLIGEAPQVGLGARAGSRCRPRNQTRRNPTSGWNTGQHEQFPATIAQAAKDTLTGFKATAEATAKAAAQAAKADLAAAVATAAHRVADQVAGTRELRWGVGLSLALAVLIACAVGFGFYMERVGRASGLAEGTRRLGTRRRRPGRTRRRGSLPTNLRRPVASTP